MEITVSSKARNQDIVLPLKCLCSMTLSKSISLNLKILFFFFLVKSGIFLLSLKIVKLKFYYHSRFLN